MFFPLSLKNCLFSADHGTCLLLLFLVFEFLTFVKIFFLKNTLHSRRKSFTYLFSLLLGIKET